MWGSVQGLDDEYYPIRRVQTPAAMEIPACGLYHSGQTMPPGIPANLWITVNRPMIKQLLLALTSCAAIFFAHGTVADGNIDNGEVLAYSCLGCHGIEGYRNAYPSYRVPRLGGQHAEYLIAALQAYRSGKRPHPTMQAHGASLSDQDIDDIAAYFQGEGAVSDVLTEDNIDGLDAARACLACHGDGGNAVIPQPATLSGQQQSYLEHALNQYKDGRRSGTVMSAFAATLSDEDIASLSLFYSQQAGLHTPEILQ